MRPRRGATLIELMVTCGVYAFMVLAMMALIKDGTNGWRNVESRSTVEANLRTFEQDIIRELKRTDMATVRITQDTYKHGIVMANAMNDPGLSPTGDPSVLGDPLQYFVKSGSNPPKPYYQRWVLYYLTQMDKSEYSEKYGFPRPDLSSNPNSDPHQWIVRKDIYYYNPPTSTSVTITSSNDLTKNSLIEADGSEPTEDSLRQEETATGSIIERARVLAADVVALNFYVLAWDPTYLTTGGYRSVGTFTSGSLAGKPYWDNLKTTDGLKGTIIEVDVKTFKAEQAQTYLNLGQTDLSNNAYTVQLNCEVTPDNDTAPASGQAAKDGPLPALF